jgi:putative phosphoribosyl transferase
MIFRDRKHAGEQLVSQLTEYKGKGVVVLSIPRGGVVVGAEIANGLEAPLDVIITRKIGAPGNPEFAIGAIGPSDQIVLNEEVIKSYKIPRKYLNSEIGKQGLEMERRERLFRGEMDPLNLENKIVILVDDGIATGADVEVAIKAIKCLKPAKLILAVPVAPPETIERLKEEVDELVCLATPSSFYAIGQFYQDFTQVPDEEVVAILRSSSKA